MSLLCWQKILAIEIRVCPQKNANTCSRVANRVLFWKEIYDALRSNQVLFAPQSIWRRKPWKGLLIFQLPYSPEFNSCEFCFRSMKAYLTQHEQFSINFTELAIIQGLQTMTSGQQIEIWIATCSEQTACESKHQHCVTLLQSDAQTNNRFHCKNRVSI